jgi:hypothetical protein
MFVVQALLANALQHFFVLKLLQGKATLFAPWLLVTGLHFSGHFVLI